MATSIKRAIQKSGLTIYDTLETQPELFLDNEALEAILNRGLKRFDLNYPNRTRSKKVKVRICEILGYPVPKSFKKTRPRFPGQNFDTAVQQANNFQPWNEEIDPSRRYVFVRVDAAGLVTKVRVVSGEAIAEYDTTGKLTQKYQARSIEPITASLLASSRDTSSVCAELREKQWLKGLLPIGTLYVKLAKLLGARIANPGMGQERNRGGELHRLVAKTISNHPYADSGQFPDIPDQMLEVKLQTAPTIDLGLVSPDGRGQVSDLPMFLHEDVRYAVFYGTIVGANVRLDHVVVTTGRDFYSVFRRFGGKIINRKLQLHLPRTFFD